MSMIEKLEALQNKDTIQQELAAVETPEEMQELLAAHGIQLTLDEVKALVKEAASLNAELDESDLENAAGGVAVTVGAAVCVTGLWALKTLASWAIDKILSKATGW